MSDTIIRVERLGKRYCLGAGRSNERYTALRDVVADKAKSLFRRTNNSPFNNGSPAETRDFWALKNVSFEVKCQRSAPLAGRPLAGRPQRAISSEMRQRIGRAIRALGSDPFGVAAKPLKGREQWRVRERLPCALHG